MLAMGLWLEAICKGKTVFINIFFCFTVTGLFLVCLFSSLCTVFHVFIHMHEIADCTQLSNRLNLRNLAL